jgi:chromosome segregation ATPase
LEINKTEETVAKLNEETERSEERLAESSRNLAVWEKIIVERKEAIENFAREMENRMGGEM